jgi:SAM-dependent methyltransferase
MCTKCGTISRYRSIARGLLRAISELSGVQVQSISELASKQGTLLSIYDTQVPFYSHASCYPIPDHLSKCKWIDLQTSIYDPNEPRGIRLAPNITNQTLEKLTFPDNRFDIIITSDVMEHVRLDDIAHREIMRVLKPHGIYLFTVPHVRDRTKTLVRVSTTNREDPSKDKFLMEPEYHGNPNANKRSLCYRVYGTDLDEILKSLGFTVHYTMQDFSELGIKGTELFYCQIAK